MRKSEEVAMILESIMSDGIMVDDRIRKAVSNGVKKIRAERFREKQAERREKYHRKIEKEERRKKCTSGSKKSR